MTVHVCATCHQLIHNDQNIDIILKKRAQHIFEDKWGREKFMEVFKKNYLWEEDLALEKSSDNWRE